MSNIFDIKGKVLGPPDNIYYDGEGSVFAWSWRTKLRLGGAVVEGTIGGVLGPLEIESDESGEVLRHLSGPPLKIVVGSGSDRRLAVIDSSGADDEVVAIPPSQLMRIASTRGQVVEYACGFANPGASQAVFVESDLTEV